MYDNEDEINSKRRTLLTIIVIVIVAIVALILFLVFRAFGGSKKTLNELTCELEVADGSQKRADGVYIDEVEIRFKEVHLVSNNYQLKKKTIGLSDNSGNGEIYRLTKTGNYKVYGYLEDEKGNTGTCDINVSIELSKPTCELEIANGVVGDNDWYNSDVEIVFKSMETNNPNTNIEKYFIEKSNVDIDVMERQSNESYIVTDEGETEIVGYVIDTDGKTGACKIDVKKDATPPTCSLKVNSGTLSDGVYKDSPTIGFESANDELSGIVEKGVGTTKNYTEQSYTLNENGTYSIYGYVKDVAGNESSCSISLTKSDVSNGGNGGGQPVYVQDPSCELRISAAPVDEARYKYALYQEGNKQIVKVIMTVSSNTTAYGIGTSETFNGQMEYIITSPGTYRVAGFVMNSIGTRANCVTPEFTVYSQSIFR